ALDAAARDEHAHAIERVLRDRRFEPAHESIAHARDVLSDAVERRLSDRAAVALLCVRASELSSHDLDDALIDLVGPPAEKGAEALQERLPADQFAERRLARRSRQSAALVQRLALDAR